MHCQCVQQASITSEVWTNVNIPETKETSEFRSPKISFLYIYNGRRSFWKHFSVTSKQGWKELVNFAIKTPVLRKIYEKCQKSEIDPFT